MKPCITRVSAIAVVLFSSALAVAADDASKPAASKGESSKPAASADAGAAKASAKSDAKAEAKAIRLTKPWKDMTSLSEDQKRQIATIHKKTVQEVNSAEQRERADIMALLNDQQKAELKSLLDKELADRKAKAAAARKPAAKPAGDRTAKGAGDDDAEAEEEAAADAEPAGTSTK